MIKTTIFCDGCKSEIASDKLFIVNRLTFNTNRDEKLEVPVSGLTMLDGQIHFCKYCVIDAVNRNEDRPRQA